MPRVALFAVIGLIYAGAASLAVREEGRRFRRSIADEPPAAAAVEPSPAPQRITPKVAPPPAVAPTPKPAPVPAPIPPPVVVIAPKPAPIPAPVPAPPPSVPGRPAAEAESLSAEDEREVGAQIHERVMGVCRPSAAGPARRRAQDALGPLLEGRERKGIGVTLTIVEADTINVFSHMGGYIYVDRGLFDLIGEDYELEFALAREVAHLDRRHAAHQVVKEAGKRPGVDLVQSAFHQIAAGYTAEQEAEADDWAYRRLTKQGRTPRQTLAYLRRLADYADNHGQAAGRRKPRSLPGHVNQDLDNHWKSAPAATERLARLKALGPTPRSP